MKRKPLIKEEIVYEFKSNYIAIPFIPKQPKQNNKPKYKYHK